MEECVSYTTTANEWHHVALVWASGTTSYLYHDGVQVAEFTGRPNSDHSNPSALGNIAGKTRVQQTGGSGSEVVDEDEEGTGYSAFDGIIDEFRVTDTGLTSAQIKTMYNSESNDDFITTADTYVQSISESVSLTDSLAKLQNLTESVSLTDSLAKLQNLTESVSLTDSLAR